jgi:hypothetical protein
VLQIADEPVGTGAEKRVFLTRDRQYAIGFYYGHLSDRRERLDRLTRILTNYNPTLANNGAYWMPYFCWPVGMADGTGAIAREFAARHQLVAARGRRRPIAQLLLHRPARHATGKEVRWFSRTAARARRSGLVADEAADRRPRRGRAALAHGRAGHADLSKNAGRSRGRDACIIDIDSLVVRASPPSVLGTPGCHCPPKCCRQGHLSSPPTARVGAAYGCCCNGTRCVASA